MTTPSTPSARTPSIGRSLAVLLLVVFLAVLVRTAWLSDDAMISLRTVLNVTHGYGMTFNVGERVQTFTHPLWLALLTAGYFVIGNVYYAAFAVSILVSLRVFWLAITRGASTAQLWLAAAALLSSRAFVDFSTSGLENPLLYLLLFGFIGMLPNQRLHRGLWLTTLWWVASLLYLTRPDAVLLAAPALVVATWRVRRPATVVPSVFIGLLPALAWTAFAVIYYGFPFPNTAYAKLGMGVGQAQLWTQGVLYFVDSIDRDPATLVAIGLAAWFGWTSRAGASRAVVAGIGLYLVYVASIGGDFMTGRFLAAPFFAAVLVLTRMVSAEQRTWTVTAVAFVVLGLVSIRAPLLSDSRYSEPASKKNGISDERVFYFRKNSLVFASMVSFQRPEWTGRRPPGEQRVMNTCGLMGEGGLEWGPHYYMLDECALADPLLARLPAVFKEEWRPGHFRRWVPDGYRESLVSGANQIAQPQLREYYDHLSLITRSRDLWSAERLRAIWMMNTGRYDMLIDRDYFRFSGFVMPLEALAGVKPDETPWDAPGTVILKQSLAVRLEDRGGRRYLDVSLDANDQYLLVFVKGNTAVGNLVVGPIPAHRRKPGLASYTLDVPPRAAAGGFDTVLVAPAGGDEAYAIGHLLIEGQPATDGELHKRVAVRDGMVRR